MSASHSTSLNLHTDEEGATYAVSLVMALPLYVAMIALIVEVSSLTSAGLAVDAAASAAARSAAVWLPLEGDADRKARQIQRAAVMSLVSVSNADNGIAAVRPGDDPEAEEAFAKAYGQFSPHRLPSLAFLREKYRAAHRDTKVTLRTEQTASGPRTIVRVEFLAPVRVPGLAYLLADSKSSGSRVNDARRLVTELPVVLENTTARTHPLGIHYDRLR
ncbi:MAG: hypothetical protein JSS02_11125 [Planctomycetes bacterium]|nr:hypothetical protein [Planctomycetota bacterium]